MKKSFVFIMMLGMASFLAADNCGGEAKEKAASAGGCGEKSAAVEMSSASAGCAHSAEGCDGCSNAEAVPKSEAGASAGCGDHSKAKKASAESEGCGGMSSEAGSSGGGQPK